MTEYQMFLIYRPNFNYNYYKSKIKMLPDIFKIFKLILILNTDYI